MYQSLFLLHQLLIIGLSFLDLRCQPVLNKTQKVHGPWAHISTEIILAHVDLQGEGQQCFPKVVRLIFKARQYYTD